MPETNLKDLLIVWRVNTYCNLGCEFCEYNRQRKFLRQNTSSSAVLSFGEILANYKRLSDRRVMVSWIGGEPLLWPHLFSIGDTYKRQYDLDLSLTTNGTMLLQSKVQKHLLDTYKEITISIDGMGKQHDVARSKYGLYNEITAAIDSLVNMRTKVGANLSIRINTILTRSTIGQFENFCLEMKNLGVNQVTFNYLGRYPSEDYFLKNRPESSQIDDFVERLPTVQANMASSEFAILGSRDYMNRIQCLSKGITIPVSDCAPGKYHLFVDEDGFIGPCSFTTKFFGINISSLSRSQELDTLNGLFLSKKQNEFCLPCQDCMCTNVFGKFDNPLED